MKNYACDLYGTLIDIRTNEKEPRLWKMLADHYSRYGVPFDGKSLRREFLRIETDMRRETAQRDNTYYPEIEIERVKKEGDAYPCAILNLRLSKEQMSHSDMLEQTSWRSDNHVSTHLQAFHLLVAAVAIVTTIYCHTADTVKIIAEALHSLIYLLGQLASR